MRSRINHQPGVRMDPWDSISWEYSVVPDLLEHTWSPPPDRKAGGTDLLATGKPGTGKSTLAENLALRIVEINDETVVWRGSTSRSEWLDLAPITTVHVPERCRVEARLEPKDPTRDTIPVAIEDIARDVKRYANPIQLNRQRLDQGRVNVVYPDPRMQRCQAIYEESDKQYEKIEFSPEDPLIHWWFAWLLARIETGPYDWMTWIADEIGDLAPESAESDEYAHYQKIQLMQDCWVDARKTGLSIFAFGHAERDIHNLIRHKIRWRCQMNGTANPTSKHDLVGFGSVKMDQDMTSDMDLGEALIYNESEFAKISWDDVPAPEPVSGMTLVVDIEPDDARRARGGSGEPSGGVADD